VLTYVSAVLLRTRKKVAKVRERATLFPLKSKKKRGERTQPRRIHKRGSLIKKGDDKQYLGLIIGGYRRGGTVTFFKIKVKVPGGQIVGSRGRGHSKKGVRDF